MISVIDPDGQRTRLHIVTHTVGLIAMSIFPALGGIAGAWYGLSAMLLGIAFLVSGLVFVGRRTSEAARLHVIASIAYLPILLSIMIVDKSAIW
jgi:protoheme IX farnesyltransferase